MKIRRVLSVIGPGILVAATGVGAGDLATAALAGSRLGVAVLWAIVLGAFLKFVLTEGLARWQLATGETLLEGAMSRLGRPAQCIFLSYFLGWSFLVSTALMSACGVATQAIVPLFDDPSTGKIVYGVVLSLAAVAMVRLGGYQLFERVMGACIGLMFVTVLLTAVLLAPGWAVVAKGLFWPTIPDLSGAGLGWTIALMGGVGGTVTVLCYGYWIREKGRQSRDDLVLCRWDLAFAYVATAAFGVAMVIIGSTIQVEGSGATLVVDLGDKLLSRLGPVGKWVFLAGAWGAVFSSMLGVWQSVPYLFSDLVHLIHGSAAEAVRTDSRTYRVYLYALAIVPMAGLWIGFSSMQKLYAISGAVFIPMLAVALLFLNGRSVWVGSRFRNRPATTALLVVTLLLSATVTWLGIRS